VSYRIKSHAGQGYVEATIWPPDRIAPAGIVIRLRHPDEKPIQAIVVDGALHQAFNPANHCVFVKPDSGPVVIRAKY
jgi:hypothetical protein